MTINSDAYIDGVGWMGQCSCGELCFRPTMEEVYEQAHFHLDKFPDHLIYVKLAEKSEGRLDPTKCYCAECYQPLGSGPCTKVEPEG